MNTKKMKWSAAIKGEARFLLNTVVSNEYLDDILDKLAEDIMYDIVENAADVDNCTTDDYRKAIGRVLTSRLGVGGGNGKRGEEKMKVYIVLEGYHNGNAESETESEVSVGGAFATRELAENEIALRLKETADEITKEDENNCSAISEICPWNGTEARITSEYCDRWHWRIVEKDVVADEEEECAYRVGDKVKWRDPETEEETDGWKVVEVNGEIITIDNESGSEAEVCECELTPA